MTAQRVQSGLRILPEDKAVEVLDFVEFLVLRHAKPERLDSQEALLDDPDKLRALYANFADEDRVLAQIGLSHYAQLLCEEENAYEAR
jgi:hypothetical protein